MLQFVIVEIATMKTELLNVQFVKINVISVLTTQAIVLFVLKTESIHQNVTFHHHLLNQLKLLIFQLVLL